MPPPGKHAPSAGKGSSPPVIQKTQALVLRIYPLTNTSHLVVWLTCEGRLLVTNVKGAMRPKSFFLGQYDLFQTCELLHYAISHNGISIARECTALVHRNELRTNWRAEHAASWFMALTEIAASSDRAIPALYTLCNEVLDCLAQTPGAPPATLFAYFEAQLLKVSGFRPNFAPCPLCGHEASRVFEMVPDSPLNSPFLSGAATADKALFFSLQDGSLLCRRHLRQTHTPSIRLHDAAVPLYETISDAPGFSFLSSLASDAPAAALQPALRSVLRFLGLFLHHHLPDAPISGRSVALAPVMEEFLKRPDENQ